jgi:ABC-type multidrug transport system fused ATPase/permease subunit
MFTKPKLLILDESTSSLDAEAESVVNEALVSLKGATTIILIAHRLTAVKNVDQIFYIDSGKIAASGTFERTLSHAHPHHPHASGRGTGTHPPGVGWAGVLTCATFLT